MSDVAEVLPMLRGHAAVFNSLSLDLGGFKEKIAPGAFSNTLDDDVRALLNHNWDVLFGRTTAGTLRLAEDRIGLAFEIDPPGTQVARDTVALIERGDLTSMSFGFIAGEDLWEKVGGEVIRTLITIDTLYDVSVVTMPAYPQTDIAVMRARRAQLATRAERGQHDLRRRRLRLAELECRGLSEEDSSTGPAREKATTGDSRAQELRRLADEIRTTGRRIKRRRILGEMKVMSSVPGRSV